MKCFLPLLILMGLLTSCTKKKDKIDQEYYIVQTEVLVKEGKVNEVLDLFKTTNPGLVSGETDWIKASFSKAERDNKVIVRAYWKDKMSYLKFSNSTEFKGTMREFSQYFAGRPKTTISKVLFEM